MRHIMIDLETMGNGSNAAIVTIAALQFDLETGVTGKEFEQHVSLESCMDMGLCASASTFIWWLGQSEDARRNLIDGQSRNPLNLHNSLAQFRNWIAKVAPDPIVWGNSARFDLGILDSAYKACSVGLPWKFWNERCVRTLSELAPEVKREQPFVGVAHHAIDDCYHQVRYTVGTYRKLKGLPPIEITKAVAVSDQDDDDSLPF